MSQGSGRRPLIDESPVASMGRTIEEPVQPVGRGGRGPERWQIVLAVIVVFLVIAVAKPWDRATPALVAVPDGTAVPTSSPTGPDGTGPERDPGIESGASGPAFAAWRRDIPAVVREHRRWGIRALVATRPAVEGAAEDGEAEERGIVEVWRPGGDGAVVDIATGDRPVVAFGVTTLPDEPALDVRVWRSLGSELAYIPTQSVVLPDSIGERLLLPPADAAGSRAWSPGQYRVDVLTGQSIVRIAVMVLGRPAPWPIAPALPPAPGDMDLAARIWRDHVGAFAVVGEPRPRTVTIVSLDEAPGPKQDQAAAWLDLGARPPARGSSSPWLEGTSLVGVMIPQGARFERARLTQISPVRRSFGRGTILDTPPDEGPDGFRPAGGTSRLAAFRAPDPDIGFAAGMYRVEGRWIDADGVRRRGAWHLDLHPRADRVTRPLLDAARTGAGIAGRWGIEGGLRGGVSRQRPGAVPIDPDVLGPGCRGGKLIPTDPGALAAGYAGSGLFDVTVSRLFSGGQTVAIPALVARVASDLFVLAPAGSATWPEGYYAIAFWRASQTDGSVSDSDRLVFCVGHFDFATGDLEVDAGTADLEAFLAEPTPGGGG